MNVRCLRCSLSCGFSRKVGFFSLPASFSFSLSKHQLPPLQKDALQNNQSFFFLTISLSMNALGARLSVGTVQGAGSTALEDLAPAVRSC